MTDWRERLEDVAADMDADVSDFVTIWVCQGPPRCLLEGDDAVAAQELGCPFCKQIRIDDDGNETTIEPGTA